VLEEVVRPEDVTTNYSNDEICKLTIDAFLKYLFNVVADYSTTFLP
jgi:hypothetical protein